MKKQFSILTLALLATILSCSKIDDDSATKLPGTVQIEFDNSVNEDDLIMESTYYSKNNDEKYNVSELKYIVSNFVLIDDQGNEFIMPKDDSYKIINEKNEASLKFNMNEVKPGTYTKIKFGLGVDQEKYTQGASGQGNLLVEAENEGMLWAWQAGYRFLKLEGLYKTGTDTTQNFFKYHIGSHGTTLDNYKEITLNLSVPAIIEGGKTPTIHIVTDVAKIFEGSTNMIIQDNPQIMVNPTMSPKVAENASKMFMVHHVHNN